MRRFIATLSLVEFCLMSEMANRLSQDRLSAACRLRTRHSSSRKVSFYDFLVLVHNLIDAAVSPFVIVIPQAWLGNTASEKTTITTRGIS